MIDYEEFLPSNSAGKWVHRIWRFEQSNPTSIETIVPDGRPELIIHLGTPYSEVSSGKMQPQILFAGQLTKPLKLSPNGAAAFWGVRFRPDGARHFLGVPVDLATDQRMDLSSDRIAGLSALCLRIKRERSNQIICSLIDDFIVNSSADAQPDFLVRQAVDRVLLDHAAEIEYGMSKRQFQRRFKREVGVSLKTLRAVRRFRSIFDRIAENDDENWLERALNAGYFDQPQMGKDFMRFLHMSPSDWIRQNIGLGTALGAADG